MADEDRMTLAPTEIYGRSDEEQQNGPKIWRRKTEEPPGNCLVYSLTIIVIVFAVCLILSLIFLRISKPEIETVSISTRDLLFSGNSTNPYFNATLVSDISIRNSNFGAFEFEDTSLRIVYADHGVVGETTIGGRRVEAHKTVRVTGIEAEIGSFRLLNTRGLDSDLRSGFLELTSVAQDTNKDADFKLNWKRVAITSMFGLGFVGNVGHFWFLSCFFHNHLAINAHVCISPNPAKLLYLRYRRDNGGDRDVETVRSLRLTRRKQYSHVRALAGGGMKRRWRRSRVSQGGEVMGKAMQEWELQDYKGIFVSF
ncbi:hypothetical protein Bca52824_059997 [Brassica carinata]|uniref:Late embryogenesis abundant protein LEA-2 subgroup domain-containing protein n=1 Tax=Brassica carinata TaxID=52824 RepID=A0A8X7UG38_BRACI|nr:hypothetical protein Bca52824_059997 [Brassica carinata]